MEDKYSDLIFQNHKSSDFGILIKYPFNVVHPVPDLDPSHIKGRNGDFLQDNNSFQNVTETFPVLVTRPPELNQFDWERSVTDWLAPPISKDGRQYQYLQFTYDPNYVYSAVQKDPFSITWDDTNDFSATGSIPFYCEPFQFRVDGIRYKPLPDSGTVYNSELQTAIPNWHFIAEGTFTLNVNGVPYEFDSMSGEFWLNGDTGDAYDKDNTLFNSQTKFPNLQVPVLSPGKNTISITADSGATITKAEYMPRWRRLI